jgi:hypothetical protein
MKVRVIPKSKRAEERVKAHGQVMLLEQIKGDKFLVKSLNKTWRGEEWLGWFDTNTEASFKEVKEKIL